MSYIIMGRDECGDEFRPEFKAFHSCDEAECNLADAREAYPEARAIWVEELKDKAYYARVHSARYSNDTYDIY